MWYLSPSVAQLSSAFLYSFCFPAASDMLPSSSSSTSISSYSSYVVRCLATWLIFDQSEAEKLSHPHKLTGPALRAAPAKMLQSGIMQAPYATLAWACTQFLFLGVGGENLFLERVKNGTGSINGEGLKWTILFKRMFYYDL